MISKSEAMSLVTQKVVNELDYNDFDRIVQEVYGKPYEIVADEETGNYQAKTYGEFKKEELDKYDAGELEQFKNTGKYSYLSCVLLQDLVNNDYLPEGEFVIEICW
jgi:hypothetical protein